MPLRRWPQGPMPLRCTQFEPPRSPRPRGVEHTTCALYEHLSIGPKDPAATKNSFAADQTAGRRGTNDAAPVDNISPPGFCRKGPLAAAKPEARIARAASCSASQASGPCAKIFQPHSSTRSVHPSVQLWSPGRFTCSGDARGPPRQLPGLASPTARGGSRPRSRS